MRLAWEKENTFKHQVFGFDISEPKRAKGLVTNYPKTKAIFPLLFHGMGKTDSIKMLNDVGIYIPLPYKLGFHNNNCFETMCIQGGIGYWQKVERDLTPKFDKMAKVEHDLTDLKGKPVTMLKDQSKGGGLVFLKPHPDYPEIKDISMMKGREPKPLIDCNGMCGINDLSKRSETEQEINYQASLF